MGRGPLIALAALLITVPSAQGAVYGPPRGKVFHGGTGGYTERSIQNFARASGRRPAVYQYFFTPDWKRPSARSLGWQSLLIRKTARQGARPILHLSTARGGHGHSVVTPRGIARGAGDPYLVHLNRIIAATGQVVYVRLMAEMNNFNNPYCAVGASGRARGGAHSAAAYRRAWRRVARVLRGGKVPGIKERLPRTRVSMMWNPFTAGLPNVPGNGPGAYWPGSRYVDWVGTDLFANSPNFRGLNRFYHDRRWSHKPFMLGEWALWGREDKPFVRRLTGWVRSHRRARMEVYNQGGQLLWYLRLRSFPASARELRRQMRSRRFNAYARELRRPRRPPKHEPEPPPDEVPALPPGPPPPQPLDLLPGLLPH